MCSSTLMDVLSGLPPVLEGEIFRERRVLILTILHSSMCSRRYSYQFTCRVVLLNGNKGDRNLTALPQ